MVKACENMEQLFPGSSGTFFPGKIKDSRKAKKKKKKELVKKPTTSLLKNKRYGDGNRVPLQREANWFV